MNTKEFQNIPLILETPLPADDPEGRKVYANEIAMLQSLVGTSVGDEGHNCGGFIERETKARKKEAEDGDGEKKPAKKRKKAVSKKGREASDSDASNDGTESE